MAWKKSKRHGKIYKKTETKTIFIPCQFGKINCNWSSELLECFQWNDNYDKKEVCKELADVVNYAILLADKLGVSLEDIVMEKLDENSKKYPVDKSKGNSKKYTEL